MSTATTDGPAHAVADPPARPWWKGGGPRAVDAGPRGVYEHLLTGPTGTYAVFLLGDQPWAFRSLDDRHRTRRSSQFRWADLDGRLAHLRVTDRPASARSWADRLHARSENDHLLPEAREAFLRSLGATEAYINASRLHITEVYLSVLISEKPVKPRDLPRLLSDNTLPAALVGVRRELRDVTAIIAREGFDGRPVSAKRVTHLLHASAGIGLPVPAALHVGVGDHLDSAGIDDAESEVEITTEPRSGTVQVAAMRGGRPLIRHVSVLTLGQQDDREVDTFAFEPWVPFARQFPFTVEWSAHVDLRRSERALSLASFRRKTADNQAVVYQEQGRPVPDVVQAQIAAARATEDEMTHGKPEERARGRGPWRLALTHEDPEELRRNVGDVIAAYAQNQSTTIHHTFAQADLYREFMPGSRPASNGGHRRSMPAAFLSTALPNVASDLGDGTGPVMGQVVSGGAGPMCIDPTWGPENAQSGLALIVGTPGSGKTTLAGTAAYWSVLRGHRTIINDPSGPLARLARMPEIARHARHLDLSSVAAGTLNPYSMVFDARPEDVEVGQTLAGNQATVEAERRSSVIETFLGLLTLDFSREAGVARHIDQAVAAVNADFDQSPWAAVDYLAAKGGLGAEIAESLAAAAGLKAGALVFPERGVGRKAPGELDLSSAILTVMTMPGLPRVTPGTPLEAMKIDERRAQPVLALAGKLAARAMYLDKEPKFIFTDELGQVVGSGDGFRAGIARASVDSRKHRTGYWAAGQTTTQIEMIGPEIVELAGLVFVGWMKSKTAAAKAIRFLGIPDGYGYEDYPLGFPTGRDVPRRFLVRDWKSRIGVYQHDLAHLPHLQAALNTDSGRGVSLRRNEFGEME